MKLKQENHLEFEKEYFLKALNVLTGTLEIQYSSVKENSFINHKEIIRQLVLMSYNGMSYRRTISDMRILKRTKFFSNPLPRSTLNYYANREETKSILQRLIQLTALFFKDTEDTLLLDSTWFGTRMYKGGHKVVHEKKACNFEETRKLHIAALKNSRVICFTKTSEGQVHDSPLFKELVGGSIKLFKITKLLADKGYCSRENYAFCQEKRIKEVFIDFRRNLSARRAKSQLWIDRINVWKNNPEFWYEEYRFRVIVENIFSSIKRKHTNYLRSKKTISQDVEILLKCLVHNLTILGKELYLGQTLDKKITLD